MAQSYFSNPLIFLIHTLFGLYILALMLRFILQSVRADFYNPVSQLLVKITNPLLRPLRRLIPGWGGIDVAALLLILSLQMLSLFLIATLRGAAVPLFALLIWSLAELLELLFHIFIFSVIAQALLSWINMGAHNPAFSLLYSINEPLLRPVRRLLPVMSGLDLSPLVVIIALQVLKMFLIPLLLAVGGVNT